MSETSNSSGTVVSSGTTISETVVSGGSILSGAVVFETVSATNTTVVSGGTSSTDTVTSTTVTSGAVMSTSVPPAATANEPPVAVSSVTKIIGPELTSEEKGVPVQKVGPTPQEIANSRQLSVIQELLTDYKSFLSVKVSNLKTQQSAATALGNLFTRALDNPTAPILDTMWNFFVENANGVLNEQIALSGTPVLEANVRQRTELAYTLFRKATKGIDVANPALVNQSAIKTLLRSPQTVAYLSAKSKTVVRSVTSGTTA